MGRLRVGAIAGGAAWTSPGAAHRQVPLLDLPILETHSFSLLCGLLLGDLSPLLA